MSEYISFSEMNFDTSNSQSQKRDQHPSPAIISEVRETAVKSEMNQDLRWKGDESVLAGSQIHSKKQNVQSLVTIQVPRATNEGAKMVFYLFHSGYISTPYFLKIS